MLPEGVEPDTVLQKSFAPVAKELNLTQDQAQKLVTLQSEHVLALQKQADEQYAQTQKQWVDELKSDKELGGDKFDASLEVAKRPITKFGDDAFRSVLEESGLGNNPAVFKFMHKLGVAMGEDSAGMPSGGGSQDKSAADLLFPTMAKK